MMYSIDWMLGCVDGGVPL